MRTSSDGTPQTNGYGNCGIGRVLHHVHFVAVRHAGTDGVVGEGARRIGQAARGTSADRFLRARMTSMKPYPNDGVAGCNCSITFDPAIDAVTAGAAARP